MPHDLDSRRRAIARAFRATARADDVTVLNRRIDELSHQVDELSRAVDALRRPSAQPTVVHIPVTPMQESAVDEEPPGGRVTVPPITAARISNQAFDVLLGAVSDREPADRIA